ncbi:MAG: hypothetical protein JWN88_3012 [Frankiales bacterium]|jgi:CheY-like chemotaxis protein|nr:hypothetical protein [Frankiales bacterium]
MTQARDFVESRTSTWQPRPQVRVVRDQLVAIDRWNHDRRSSSLASATPAQSREARLDQARRLDVVRRQHEALVARTAQHLGESANPLWSTAARRAVLVHRNEWFRGRIAAALADRGVDVVTQLDNGAEAVGCAVAEQPDLILVEDSLSMLTGTEVLRAVRDYAPATLCAAQASSRDRIAELEQAGADLVFTRQTAPLDVAVELGHLLGV